MDCRKRNKKAADNKMLPYLKVFFAAAHRKWRLSLRNKTGTPYSAAHKATAQPDRGQLQEETVDAITKLAIATASDHAAIAQLTARVERLTEELVTVNAKLVTSLQPQHASQGGRGGPGRGRGRGAGTTTQTGAVLDTRTNDQYLESPIHYCWMCGPGCRHNSAKCPAPATGHVYTATKQDMQGRAEAKKMIQKG